MDDITADRDEISFVDFNDDKRWWRITELATSDKDPLLKKTGA